MKPMFKLIISFVVGLLLGGAATGFYIHHCFARAWVNSGNHHHMLNRLTSELNLDADQQKQIGQIFDEQIPRLDAIRVETNAKLKTLRDATSQKVALLLNGEQKKKFSELRIKWEARENKNSKGWNIPGLPPGPPPGPRPDGSSPDSQAPAPSQSKTSK
jgi:hypothetical protein